MGRVDLILFPRDDADFRRAVEQAMARQRPAVSVDQAIESVASILRKQYPHVLIRQRHAEAEIRADGNVTWYCYRDGTALKAASEGDRPPRDPKRSADLRASEDPSLL